VGESARDPTDHPIEEREQVGASWRGEQHERQTIARVGEHAIGDGEMEMYVQVDQAAETLHERDGAGPRRVDTTGACNAALPGADRANDEAADPAGPRWVTGEAQAQRLGHGQDPLAVRRARQDAIDQMCRGVRHPPRGARRADAAAFARERDEELVGARLAPHAREAMSEDATAQVLRELAVDIARQAARMPQRRYSASSRST
jgi:hypothetical protein